MADEKLIFDLLTGQNTLNKDLNKVSGQISSIEGELSNIGKNVPKDVFTGAFAAGVALEGIKLLGEGLREIIGLIGDGINAAAKEEAAISALSQALASNGVAVKQNVKLAEDFATALEKTTKFSSDTTLNTQALLASLTGLSGQGLNKATQAAADLATVLGTDLETAARQLAKAAQGGDERLAKLGVRFVKGRTDAETFQNVLIGIEKQFGGRAQAAANTFAGALTVTSNAIDNVSKAVGKAIIKTPELIAAFQTIASAFNSITESIASNSGGITSTIGSIITGLVTAFNNIVAFGGPIIELLKSIGKQLLDAFGPAIDSVIELGKIIGSGIADALQFIAQQFAGITLFAPKFGLLGDIFLIIGTAINFISARVQVLYGLFQTLVGAVVGVASALLLIGTRIAEFIKQITSGNFEGAKAVFANFGEELAQSIAEPVLAGVEKVTGAIDKFASNQSDLVAGLNASGAEADKASNKFNNLTEKVKQAAEQVAAPQVKAEVEVKILEPLLEGAQNFIKNVKSLFSQATTEGGRAQQKEVLNQVTGFAKGIGGALSAGAEGAHQVFGKIVDTFAEIATKALSAIPIAGPIIAAVAEVIKFLARGADFVRKQSEAFFAEFERIPTNILQALPVLISQILGRETVNFAKNLVNAIPIFVSDLITAILGSIPLIIKDLIKNLPKFIAAFLSLVPRIAIAFIQALIFEIPKLIPAIALAMVEGITEAFNDFKNKGENFVQNAGNVVSDIGNFFGFADGGMVPGFGNKDSVPAMLTPGEVVIPKDQVKNLTRQGPQQITVILQLDGETLAKSIISLKEQGLLPA